jgi:hypothetical protein
MNPAKKKTQKMNTYEKISILTPKQVADRVAASCARADKYIGEMSERTCRRHVDGVNKPDDMDPGNDFLCVAALRPTAKMHGNAVDRHSKNQDGLTTPSATLGCGVKVRSDATPVEIVEAITALDAYADAMERAASEYRAATQSAIVRHIAAQSEATRTLIGMVGSVSISAV